MKTKLPEGKIGVLWDDGEFILARVKDRADRTPTILPAAYPTPISPALLHSDHSLRGELEGVDVGGG